MDLLFIVLSFGAAAQLNIPKYEIGLQAGFFVYQGDLTPEQWGAYRTPGIALGISGSRILGPSFSLRAAFQAGRLRGDDSAYANPEYRRHRNFRFTTPVYELSGQLVWNILGHNYVARRGTISPYLFAGAGLSVVNIKRDWSRFDAGYFENEPATLQGLQEDQQRNPPKLLPVIPVGAGVRFTLSPRVDLQAETNYRFTFTDYLDGFSRSVNPDKKDAYHSHTVGVVYRLGMKNSFDCPPVAMY
jgi:opacity protein-like surface antigen